MPGRGKKTDTRAPPVIPAQAGNQNTSSFLLPRDSRTGGKPALDSRIRENDGNGARK